MGNSLKKNVIYNSIGNFIYFFCQWLMTVVVVRVSGFEDAGIFTLAMSITTVFYCISLLGVRNFQISDIKEEYTNEQYIKTRGISAFVSFFACILVSFFMVDTTEKFLCVAIYMIFKIIEAFGDVFHGIDQKYGRMDIIGISMTIRGIAMLVSFFLCLYFTKNLLISLIVISAITLVLLIVYDFFKTKKFVNEHKKKETKSLKSLLVICIPLTVTLLLTTLIPNIPRFILEMYYGSEILGIYASVAMPAIVVQTASTFVFAPVVTPLSEAYNQNKKKDFFGIIKKCMISILGIAVFASVGAYLLGDFGLSILYGEQILEHSYLLIPALFCSFLTALVWFLCSLLTIIREIKAIIICNAVSAILCIVLSFLLVSSQGMAGVNYSIIITLLINASAQYIWFRLKAKLKG